MVAYESVDMHMVVTVFACLITLRCGQIAKLVLRLGMSGATLTLPPYAFMASQGQLHL